MRFFVSSGGKYSFSTIVLIAVTCMVVLGGFWLRLSPVHAASSPVNPQIQTYTSVTKGKITPAGIANLRHPSPAALATSTNARVDKGALRIPVRPDATATHVHVNAPGLYRHIGTILENFNGVSSRDSEVVNPGHRYEPPDQGLCVGNGFVVEPVNSALAIYHTDGSLVLGPLNYNVLFNEGRTVYLSDPRCYFDKTTNTWIASILYINGTKTNTRIDIAVNHSSDPTTPWTVYHLEATDDGTNGTPIHSHCPCFGDQPLLGFDNHNVYITTNEVSLSVPLLGYNGAQVYAIAKSQLFSLQPANFVHFDNLLIGGQLAASLQPAFTIGSSDAGFFLNSLDPFDSSNNNYIGVWALTNREAVKKGGVPTLSSLLLPSEAFSTPPVAQQKGNTMWVDGGDDRMQQVQFIQGSLWGALDTLVTMPNDTNPYAGIAWFKIRPEVQKELISSATIENQGYVASPGNYLLYPAIQAGRDNSAVIAFTFIGPNDYPSAAYTVMPEGSTSFKDIRIAAAGNGPYNQGSRWGDYSWAVLDPDANRFWLGTEYIPPVSSQTIEGTRNWGTRVFSVDGRS